MGGIVHDARFAVRMLMRSPVVSAAAVAILAVGIGANTALFSAIQGVILDPLPFPHGTRLVAVRTMNTRLPEGSTALWSVSYPNYRDWRASAEVFDELGAMEPRWLSMTGQGDPRALTGWAVSDNYFSVFGMPMAIGRAFTTAETEPGAGRVAILGHALWLSAFGGDPGVLGRVVTLDGEGHRVVGVADPALSFRQDFTASIYLPLVPRGVLQQRDAHMLQVIGRLKPGVTLEQAAAEMRAVARALETENPRANAGLSAHVTSLAELLFGTARPLLKVLFGAVAALLLIACVNVAGILLARSSARHREFALRLALGAGRRRLAIQLLAESATVVALAGVVGSVLALEGINLMRGLVGQVLLSGGEAGATTLELDLGVLAFAVVVTLLAILVVGVLPAVRVARAGCAEALKAGSVGSAAAPSRSRALGALVVFEIATAVVLLVGGGALVRSYVDAAAVTPGFSPEGVWAFEMTLPPIQAYATSQARAGFAEAVLERVRALPTVDSAAMVNLYPMSGNNWGNGFTIAGRPLAEGEQNPTAEYRHVSTGCFATMGIPILRGRRFEAADDGSHLVAIVNQEFVRRHFPGEDPIGQRIVLFQRPLEIIGVVGNIKHRALVDVEDAAFMYEPISQFCWLNVTVLVQSTAVGEALVESVRDAVWEVSPTQAITRVTRLKTLVRDSISPQRTGAGLLGGMAAIALALAVAGLYAVVSFAVSQRTREIGIRTAMGASPGGISRLILGRGLRLALVGAVVGTAAALALERVLGSVLAEVGPVHGGAYLVAVSTLLVATAAGCYLPARKAARLDPLSALRHE